MRGRRELSDAQWEVIEPILRPKRRADGRGRSVAGHTSGAQRASVGLGHGGAVARIAQEVSAVPNLPTAVSSNGYGRASCKGSCACWPRSCTPEENWNWKRPSSTLFHGGEKGGLSVGPTKRGKGKKILTLADNHSLPLAKYRKRFAPRKPAR